MELFSIDHSYIRISDASRKSMHKTHLETDCILQI